MREIIFVWTEHKCPSVDTIYLPSSFSAARIDITSHHRHIAGNKLHKNSLQRNCLFFTSLSAIHVIHVIIQGVSKKTGISVQGSF